MKKIFSAFLLMTMMVASVGSFVSCSDIEESIAAVDEATKDNAASIKDLESKIAALQTALQTAQSEAAAAKAEANAAKQAAATAKAEAIAAALAEIEKVNGDVDAVNAEIKKINDALAGCATKEAVELLQATIDEYKALTDENAEAIAALEEALAALGENVTPEQLAEVVAKMTAIDEALVAFQNRLQSVSYVPEWKNGPSAVLFAENEEYGYLHMSYEVAPAAYASNITAENTKLVGVALKGVEVEEHDVKILSADPETGIVEVLAYIGVDSEVWKTTDAAAVALRVVAEDAQFTSAYTNVAVIGGNKAPVSINDFVFFGTYNEYEKFVTNEKNEDGDYQPTALLHEVSYNTAVADSEVALFEGLVARVNVPGFFEYVPVEEAAKMFGIEIKVTEKLSSFATKYFVTTVDGYNWVEDAEGEKEPNETPAFIVAKDQTLDITVKFNETVVDSLKKAETLATQYKGKKATAALKAGYFQVNGKKANTFAGMTATYKVVGPQQDVELVLNNNEAINVEWSTENYAGEVVVSDVDVTGGDARAIANGEVFTGTAVDKDGKAISGTPEVTVKFISVDNADVTINLTEWPEEATTYTYIFEKSLAGENDTTINVTFDLTITVNPAPEQIGEVPASAVTVTLVKSGVEVKADETPWPATQVALTGVVEKLLPYYKEYFKSEKQAKDYIVALLTAGVDVNISIVDADAGEIDETFEAAATYKYSTDATTKAENSKITIPYDVDLYEAMSKQYVQFSFNVNIYGIVATVTADCAEVSEWVKYTAPGASIEAGVLSPAFQGAQPVEYLTNTHIVYVMGTDTDNDNIDDNDLTSKVDNDGYKLDKDGNKIIDWYSTYITPSKKSYVLPTTFKFSDYITIKNVADADKTNYYVRWSVAPVKGIHYVEKTVGTTKTYITRGEVSTDNPVKIKKYPKYVVDGTDIPTFVFNTAANAAPVVTTGKVDLNNAWNGSRYVGVSLSNIGVCSLDWNGSEITSCIVKFELVDKTKPADDAPAGSTNYDNPAHYPAVDYIDVNFNTPAMIASVDATDVEVKWNKATVSDKVNFASGVAVTDMFGQAVYNQGADREIDNFWNDFVLDNTLTSKNNTAATGESFSPVYKTGTNTNYLKVYDQTIRFVTFDHDNDDTTAEVYISNTAELAGTLNGNTVEGPYFTFNTESGAFTFSSTTAPANDVTFTACVEVRYKNDNANPIYKTVNIVVKK